MSEASEHAQAYLDRYPHAEDCVAIDMEDGERAGAKAFTFGDLRALLGERTEMEKLLMDVITDWESDWEGKPQGQVSDAVLERIRTMLWPLPPLPEAPT